MNKVIALLRVSTKSQTIDSQREKVIKAILNDGYDESDIIEIEDIESASKLSEEERSGLNKLKRHIETDQVSTVYVYEISRISRKESILYSIREYLQKHKVQLICLTPPFRMFNDDWSISDQAAFTFSIFSTLAAQETRLRVERITRGKERKKAEGKLSVGKPIFGYEVDKDHYIRVHPQDSLIIKEIFERYCTRESSGSIGNDLWLRNALHTKSNKKGTYQTYVSWILRDRRYAKMDEDSIYPPIISKELFLKTQELLSNMPERFKRKGKTKEVYPLQGYIINEEGYKLIPSITNNRYVKMDGSTIPISLNMKAADELSKQIMNNYLQSGAVAADAEKQRIEIQEKYDIDKIKLNGIDSKIIELESENDRINKRIIKGRMSETEGDKMIDSNKDEIKALEDLKQELTYNISVMSNKLILLSNPLHLEIEIPIVQTNEELKEAVHKYLKKIVAKKIGFSHYLLTYYFLDGIVKEGEFHSNCKRITYTIK